jgi:tetratricopeptide (TPR) repeat protein
MSWPSHISLAALTMTLTLAASSRSVAASTVQRAANSTAAPHVAQDTPGVRAAIAAYERGDYDTAQREIQPLLKANPNSFPLNELAGLLEAARRDDQLANPYLAKAVRLAPNNSAARSALAMNLMRLHRAADAGVHFRKAAELDPSNHDANHNLGEFYIQSGKVAAAIPSLKRAQDLQPADYDNGYDLALAYEQTGKLDDARRQLQALVKIRDTAELHSVLGEVEEKSKNYLAAAREYEQAARMEPSENNIFDLGAELLLHQTFEPAVAVFRAGAQKYPASARLALGLGVALYGNSHYDEAAAQFFRVSDANRSDPLPLLFLGRSYDNFSPAVAEQVRARLKQAAETFSQNAQVQYFYAAALWKLHQDNADAAPLPEIESLLRRAAALDPRYGDAYLQLGIVLASQQKYADAIAQYRQALKYSAMTAPIHYRLGQALSRTGDTAAAQQELAIFEQQRAKETSAAEQQNAAVEQFVYTMKKPDE